MTTGVQRRRGTTVQHSTFTGLEGEITVDTTKDTAVVHDGTTVGGHPLAKQSLSNVDPTALDALTGSNTASGDLFLVYDVSTSSLKKITRDELNNAIEQDALANVTITGGSINGTTVGASTASTGAFTTLSASGAFSANGGATLGDASGDALTINSSAVSIPNGLNFDSNTLVIDATNNRVGVGTASPSYALDVSGTSRATKFIAGATTDLGLSSTLEAYSATYANLAAFRSIPNDGVNPYLLITSSSSGITFEENGSAYGALMFKTGASESMRITNTGLVGIGTSSPSTKLEVSSSGNTEVSITSSAGTPAVSFIPSGTGIQPVIAYKTSTGAALRIGTVTGSGLAGYATQLTLDSSGNLGLGVTPSAWYSTIKAFQFASTGSLEGRTNSGSIALASNSYIDTSGDTRYITTNYASRYQQNAGQHIWYNAPSGTAGNAITFTQAMTLDASGNLGIGTSSPSYKLHTNGGDVYFQNGNVFLQDDNKALVFGTGTTSYIIGSSTNNNQRFITNNTERMRIDSSGNVGIGTSSPTTDLSIFGGTGASQGIIIQASGWPYNYRLGMNGVSGGDVWSTTNYSVATASVDSASYATTFISQNVSGQILFGTGGVNTAPTERMRIDSSGRVLIGSTISAIYDTNSGVDVSSYWSFQHNSALISSETKVMHGTAQDSGFIGSATLNTSSKYVMNSQIQFFKNSTTAGSESGYITFGTQSSGAGVTEKMRIDSSGNLLLGTTSGSYKFNVTGNGSTPNLGNFTSAGTGTAAVVQIQAHNGAGLNPELYLECPGSVGGGLFINRATTQLRMWLGSSSSGVSLASGGTSWGSYSDERIKDIIEPITNATEKVSTLRAVIGKYKTDSEDKRRAFLIAQDVQAVLPEAVYENSAEDDTLNLAYTDVIPLLVAAIKELKAEVDSLKAQLNK